MAAMPSFISGSKTIVIKFIKVVLAGGIVIITFEILKANSPKVILDFVDN